MRPTNLKPLKSTARFNRQLEDSCPASDELDATYASMVAAGWNKIFASHFRQGLLLNDAMVVLASADGDGFREYLAEAYTPDDLAIRKLAIKKGRDLKYIAGVAAAFLLEHSRRTNLAARKARVR